MKEQIFTNIKVLDSDRRVLKVLAKQQGMTLYGLVHKLVTKEVDHKVIDKDISESE